MLGTLLRLESKRYVSASRYRGFGLNKLLELMLQFNGQLNTSRRKGNSSNPKSRYPESELCQVLAPTTLSHPHHHSNPLQTSLFTHRTKPKPPTMLPLPKIRPRGLLDALKRQTLQPTTKRTLIAAPKPNSGPLMERRADRALPSLTSSNRWLRTLPLFAVIMVASTLAIFNYQKSSSSVVNSTLYALRTSSRAREILGDEIYFASQIPWIGGEINQLHGKIDIWFWVKGTRARGLMRFRSERKQRMGYVSSFFLLLFCLGCAVGGCG